MVSESQALEQGDLAVVGDSKRSVAKESAAKRRSPMFGNRACKIVGAFSALALLATGVLLLVFRASNERETIKLAEERYTLATESAVHGGSQVCETTTGIRVAYDEINATHISLPVFNMTLPSGTNPCEMRNRESDRRKLPSITLYASSSAVASLTFHKMRLLNTGIEQESKSDRLLTDQDSLSGAPVHLLTGSFSGWWSNTVTLGLMFGGGTINCNDGTHQNYRQLWSDDYGGSHWAGSYATYCYFYDETIF